MGLSLIKNSHITNNFYFKIIIRLLKYLVDIAYKIIYNSVVINNKKKYISFILLIFYYIILINLQFIQMFILMCFDCYFIL